MKFRVYDNFDDVPLDEAQWDALVAASDNKSIFLQRFWILAWWRYFCCDNRLFFVTAEDNGDVIAFAPLMIDRHRILRFIGDVNADYMGFVIPTDRPELLDGFLQLLHERRDAWNSAHLRNIPRDALAKLDLPQRCRNSGFLTWNNYSVSAPYLPIRGNEEGLEQLFHKYSIRRAIRQLEKSGELRFESFSSDSCADQYWAAFADQHKSRCKSVSRASSFDDENYLPFLKSLFESDATRDRVHFCGLFQADRPIAFHFGFISENRLLWYKPSIDPSLRKGSPGIALIQQLVRLVQRRGLDELDFTIGEEAFKDRFSREKRVVDTYRIHNSRIRYYADVGYWRIRQKVKRMFQ